MEQPLYPAPSKDLTQKRRDLAPEIFTAFQAFSQRVFADGALPSKTKELLDRCGARDPVPVLHPQPHRTRDAEGRQRAGDYGSNLGCGRDEGGRGLVTFCHCD